MPFMINARIMYDQIKMAENGFYAWVRLMDESLINLLVILKTAPCNTFGSSEIHCTLMSCRDQLPELLLNCNPDGLLFDGIPKARIASFEPLVDHKNRTLLIAHLDSEDLQAMHQTLTAGGLKHSFDDYMPHITLAKGIEVDAPMQEWLRAINKVLVSMPLYLEIDPEVHASQLS